MLTQSTRLEKFGFPIVETSVAVTNPARTARTVSLSNAKERCMSNEDIPLESTVLCSKPFGSVTHLTWLHCAIFSKLTGITQPDVELIPNRAGLSSAEEHSPSPPAEETAQDQSNIFL